MAHSLSGPEPTQQRQRLVDERSAAVRIEPDGIALGRVREPGHEREQQPPVRQDVEAGQLLGQPDDIAPGQEHRRPELQAWMAGRLRCTPASHPHAPASHRRLIGPLRLDTNIISQILRAWKKNDSAHVEQKNGAVVRQLVGYDRCASKAAHAQLQRVYDLARLHVNFFQPVEKLVTKRRDGARSHRIYDRAQTPYQRLCAAGLLSAAERDALETLYQSLNPLQLRRELEAALERLWTLASPDPHRSPGDTDTATPCRKSSPGGS